MSHLCDGRDLSCLGCAGLVRRQAELRAAMTIDDRLDDIKRARIWNRLEDRIAEPRAERRYWLVGACAAAATLVVVVLGLRRGTDHDRQMLTAPAESTLMSAIGPHARTALVGPGQLEIVGTPGDDSTVRLRSGTLLAEFEGGAGRSLRIEAPGATVEVVGTLFAVEASDHATCVSVAHGRVRVTLASGVILVGGGQRVCSDTGGVHELAPTMRDTLARHETLLAMRGSASPTAAPLPAPGPGSGQILDGAGGVTVPPVAAPVTVAMTTPVPTTPTMTTATTTPAMPTTPTATTTPAMPTTPTATTTPAMPTTPTATTTPAMPTAPTTTPATTPSTTPQDPAPAPEPEWALPTRSADTLYRAAEAAIRQRDVTTADRELAALVAEFPTSPLVDQALYERARLAFQRHAWAEARRHLDRLAAIADTGLAEPGRYLTCRIAVEAHDGDAARCLGEYRAAYPRSPHDLDVLGLLTRLAHADGNPRDRCSSARPFLDELGARYPDSQLTRAWRARCPEARQ